MADRIRVSSSQHSTYNRCHRLWWFLYVQRMPTPPRAFFDFGTILHEVCERYLLADELGKVPYYGDNRPQIMSGQIPGMPVELFPDGWDATEGRSLTGEEAYLIKSLIAKAIDEGILERQDGRMVEHWFEYEILDGVDMVGMIDVLNPTEIQDHKSTKDMKWAESPESLERNVQMLNYAKVLLDMHPLLEEITLRHNVYCKNPNKMEVRKVETTVTKQAILSNYEDLLDVAEDMKELENHGPKLDDWKEVEGPNEPGACGAYGGCPMRSICGFKSSPDAYIKRTNRKIKNHDPLQKASSWADKWGRLTQVTKQLTEAAEQTTKELTAMKDIFANVNKLKGVGNAPSEPAGAPGINGGEVAPDDGTGSSEPLLEPAESLPWAFAGCRACEDAPVKGLNSNGNPCFICRSLNKKAGERTDMDYTIARGEGDSMVWEAKDGKTQGETTLPATPEPKVSTKQNLIPATPTPLEDVDSALDAANGEAVEVEAEKAKRRAAAVLPPIKDPDAPAPEPEPEVVAEPETVAVEAEATVKVTKKPGRQPRGYRVYVDCMPLGVKTTMIENLFQEMGQEMANSQGVASYYDLPPFERRDAWHKLPEGNFQEKAGSVDIVSRNPSGDPDLKAFLTALMGVAKTGHVVQGMS